MEDTPAVAYRRLTAYYASCRTVVEQRIAAIRLEAIPSGPSMSSEPQGPHSPPSPRTSSLCTKPSTPSCSPPPIMSVFPPSMPWGGLSTPMIQHERDLGAGDKWLARHLDELSLAAAASPGRLASTTKSVYEAATAARQWCSSCQGFADKLLRVSASIQEMPLEVSQVVFAL
ncbi:hypothetical protein BV20DRAFT_418386 [Pilatotrama ljubarskyi]|nr:hypothetical protein BV20DRAFT_418386 [Pilatotrama ljubarskyi]